MNFKRILAYLFSFLRPMPAVKQDQVIFEDGTRDHGICSIRSLGKGGFIFTPYNTKSRHDAWVKVMDNDGNVRDLIKSDAETYGRGDWHNGWLWIPAEHRNGQVVRVHGSGVIERRGYKQPAQYANVAVGQFSAYHDRGKTNFIWDMETRQTVAEIPASGIVSGLLNIDGQWIGAEMILGITSSKGWHIDEGCTDLCEFAGDVYAFMRSGKVRRLDIKKGKLKSEIANTGCKSRRAWVQDGRMFWTTRQRDEFWCYDGRKAKRLAVWDEHVYKDPFRSGSLFGMTGDANGDNVVLIGRGRPNGGYEIRRLVIG